MHCANLPAQSAAGACNALCSTCGTGPLAEALKELEYPVKLQKLLLTPQREVLVELVITKDRRAAVAGALATVAGAARLCLVSTGSLCSVCSLSQHRFPAHIK